jgi:two-component system response regulator PhcR
MLPPVVRTKLNFQVLVVDDDPDALEALTDVLSTVPHCLVTPAASFREGLARLRQRPWHMVMADERLRDGRGTDLLAEAARLRPGCARVLTTAFRDRDILVGAINEGSVERYFDKPWDPQELVAWVRERLTSGRTSMAQGRIAPTRG